jgi:hypothetical protein
MFDHESEHKPRATHIKPKNINNNNNDNKIPNNQNQLPTFGG